MTRFLQQLRAPITALFAALACAGVSAASRNFDATYYHLDLTLDMESASLSGMVRVEGRVGLMIDEKTVTAEHDGGVDAVPPPDGRDQVANGGQRRSGKGSRSVRRVRMKSSTFRLLRHPSLG